MPTCWFCGGNVPMTRQCARCKQEFGDCHGDPATHDCPGIQVTNPYVAIQDEGQSKEKENPLVMEGYTCTRCGMKVDYSSRCEDCKKQFCIDHVRPDDHHCPVVATTIPVKPKLHPRLNASLADTSCFDQKTLIPKPAPPPRPQRISQSSRVQKSTPRTPPALPTLPKPQPLPKINISAAQTDVTVGCLLQACRDCSEDTGLQNAMDPSLGEFILSDPTVLAMFKTLAQDQSLREKFQMHPLTRGLNIWFNAMGKDLESLATIGDEVKIPIAELSLHELLQHYYSHLTDIASILDARDTGGTPRENPLERWIQEHVGESAKGSLVCEQAMIDEIAKITREAGDREIPGYLVGRREAKGNIACVSRCIPLLLGDKEVCFSSPKELLEVLEPLSNTGETVVGIFHSHPGNSMPCLSPQDIHANIMDTFRLSLFECLRQLDVNLAFLQRMYFAFHLSKFEYPEIRYLVDVIFATIVFAPAINPILDIVQQHSGAWEDIKEKIDTILQKVGITPTPVDWPLLPFVDVIISPDYRYIGAGGLSHDPDLEHPGEMKTTPFFYHIQIKSEAENKE